MKTINDNQFKLISSESYQNLALKDRYPTLPILTNFTIGDRAVTNMKQKKPHRNNMWIRTNLETHTIKGDQENCITNIEIKKKSGERTTIDLDKIKPSSVNASFHKRLKYNNRHIVQLDD